MRPANVQSAADFSSEAKQLIDRIAGTPRFAGSASEVEARHFCAAQLRGAGFQVTERGFDFSEWPGRWGIPFVTGTFLFGSLLIAAVAGRNAAVAGVAFIVFAAGGSCAFKLWRNSATARMSWLRGRSVNLEASRGSPRVWLVAHLDSKSQSIPMLARVASHVVFFMVLGVGLLALLLADWRIARTPAWGWFAPVASLAALPALLCFVGNRSPGALDNATGVTAVLLAARLVPKNLPVGVLLTSAEELDLAGARAWSEQVPRNAVIINCDTVDDSGDWRCMYRFRSHGPILAAEEAARQLGLKLRVGRMIPGILTDSIAFEAVRVPAVTISRGTLGTLARLHTAGDNSDKVTGAGAATAASLLAGIVQELS